MDEKAGLVVLAAGNSSRMGACKFLLKTNEGISILEKIIRDANEFGFDRILVVVNENTYKDVMTTLKFRLNEKLRIVVNQRVELERFFSIQLALIHTTDLDYVFVHNADNPHIDKAVLDLLFEQRKTAPVVIPCYEGKGGHPVLFNKKIAQEVLKADTTSRLDLELKRFDPLRLNCNNEKVLCNIDTKEDYQKFLSNTLTR